MAKAVMPDGSEMDPKRFKLIEKAIRERDVTELAWGLADLWLQEMRAIGECPSLGKVVLMQVVQTLSASKNEASMSKRFENVSELKTWISRNGKSEEVPQ
jgi:hypothetical protein